MWTESSKDSNIHVQVVFGKFKSPNLIISLLTYPINIDRLYLQSNESDSVVNKVANVSHTL